MNPAHIIILLEILQELDNTALELERLDGIVLYAGINVRS
jgi:hypothetical protein